MVFDERLYDGIKSLLNDFLRLELRQADLVGDGFNYIFLGHFKSPLVSMPTHVALEHFRTIVQVPSVNSISTSVKIPPDRDRRKSCSVPTSTPSDRFAAMRAQGILTLGYQRTYRTASAIAEGWGTGLSDATP